MNNETNELCTDEYIRGDCCYATVTSRDRRGSYLQLDNGQRAFARGVGNLQNGAKILCTITRSAVDGKRAVARLDSICSLYDACA
ncbi:MAG: hypothetical protein HFI38_07155 [Lachnospiraceae bacterium]|jgi:hypothetical protein|nr:hypothetical protein [Lachnospiraceae bacterium]